MTGLKFSPDGSKLAISMSTAKSAGDVWVYSASILHASDRASAGGRRRVLQLSYSADPLPGGLEWLGI